MFYLKDIVSKKKLQRLVDLSIIEDSGMRESSMKEIVRRLGNTFKDEQYLKRVSESRQRLSAGFCR